MLQTDKRTVGQSDRRTGGQKEKSLELGLRPRLLLLLQLQLLLRLGFLALRDVCGRAKMYSFWDVFNFSLKSLSVVVFCASSVSLSLSHSFSPCSLAGELLLLLLLLATWSLQRARHCFHLLPACRRVAFLMEFRR